MRCIVLGGIINRPSIFYNPWKNAGIAIDLYVSQYGVTKGLLPVMLRQREEVALFKKPEKLETLIV